MSGPNLRKVPRVSYYESQEPDFDEYTIGEKRPDLVSAPRQESKIREVKTRREVERNHEDEKNREDEANREVEKNRKVERKREVENCISLRPNLRKRPRVSYYDPEEPSFDEYMLNLQVPKSVLIETNIDMKPIGGTDFGTYCDECTDYVYEYCAIHGPLLVVPDDKVPLVTTFPAYVPRAALTIPHVFLHLAPSVIPGAGLGVFSTLTLPRGVRFGPYCGERTPQVDSIYCWQIYDRNNKRSHVVDAANSDRSNWMRYVNCARHWREQNLLAYQYQGQLYYRTIKIIPRFTELMVFYGSEFANALRINLSKYNKKQYYEEVIGASIAFENKMDKVEEMNIDQFVFIDQEQDGKENNQRDVVPFEGPNIKNSNVSSNLDTSTMQVEYNDDNITINFTANDKDDNNKLKCNICQKNFAKMIYLNRHTKLHLIGNKLYNCQFCDFQTDSKRYFDKHVEYHTKTFKYSCEKCFYRTNAKASLYRHSLLHKNKEIKFSNTEDKLTCIICKTNFSETNDLIAHTRKLHLNGNKCFSCQFCDFQTDSKINHDKHTEFHTKSFEYSCNECFYKTNSKKNFNNHYLRHENAQNGINFKCDFCPYSNNLKYNLSRHISKNH